MYAFPPYCKSMIIMPKFALSLLVIISVAWCKPDDDEAIYYSELEEVNVDDILKSERLLKNYFNCFMGRGKCTPLGRSVRGKRIGFEFRDFQT